MDKINPDTLGLSIVVLLVALVCRMVGTYFAVCGGELTVREKIFMAFAWLPKATVQAALGPVFLDMVLKLADNEWDSMGGDKDKWIGMGTDILTLAVLSILITAPLGAVSILALGPKLLTKDATEEEADEDEKPKPVDIDMAICQSYERDMVEQEGKPNSVVDREMLEQEGTGNDLRRQGL